MTKKRWIVWIIAGAMAASMTACGGTKDGKADDVQVVAENMVQKGTESEVINKKDQEPASEAEMGAVGGWSKAASPEITEAYKKMFEKLNSTLCGAQYEPVALLETQVVAGTNYRFLCRITATVPDAKPYYAVVDVYEDLQGEVSITNTVDSKVEAPTEPIPGGYTEAKNMQLTDEAKKAFDQATATLTGMTYEPLLLVGTQVVAGTNYMIFCKAEASTAVAEQSYAFLTIYEDLQGKAEVYEIQNLGAEEETEKEAEKATENEESGKTTESTEKFEKFETDTEEQSSTEAESEPIEGGWTKADSAKITKEHKKLFEKATKELVGATYEPVALLETQVVAGTNYRFLCKITPVVPNGKPRYSVVELYEDLSGNVSITKTMDSELEAPTEQLDGGYSEDISMKLSKDAKVAFSKATETLTGVSYDPVLFLGSQVVAGTNYRILCRTTAATAGAEEGYAILTIYADLEGNATISDIAELK